MFIVILTALLTGIIAGLVIVVVKTVASPKKLEAVPRLIKQGKTTNAIKIAKQMIAKDPKNYMAHYYLGKAYLKENKKELAIIEYRTVDENALFGEGIDEAQFRAEYAPLLMASNQQNEALKNFLLLTKQAPNNADNFFQVGQIYEQQGRYDLALGFMQKAAMLDKKNAKAHAEIGFMYYRTKKFKEAKKEIDLAIKLNPENYTSYYYLGKILKDQKDMAGAIKAFEKAQRASDVKQKAIIERGSCYMAANRYDNAILDFQRAVELDKDNANQETLFARYFLAACYEKMRKIDKAFEQWEAINRKNKNFRDVPAKLAEYKDLQANDFLKDYLTSSNDEFVEICKNTASKGLGLKILSCDSKKWGCEITGINQSDDSFMSVKKQVALLRFYRNPEPIEESAVTETLDTMKSMGSVKSFIFSSSEFSLAAKRYAENRPIELVEKEKLEAVLSKAGA